MSADTVAEVSATRERATVAIMFAIWGFVFLDRMSVLYLAPYLAPSLHLNDAQIGWLAGIAAVFWGVAAPVFGAISDRFGRKAVLVPMVVLLTLASAASGLAHDYWQLLWTRALLGLAGGPCFTLITALVEENSAAQHRGRNVGIVVSAAAVIGLAMAPVLTTQVAAHYGWSQAFFVAAAPGVVLAILIAVFVKEPAAQRSATGAHPAAADRPRFAQFVPLLGSRNVWASALAAAGLMIWLFLVNGFGPLYITEVQHQTGTTAGFLMGAAGLGSFFLGLIGPALSDRFGRRPVLAVCGALSMLLPLAMLASPLYHSLWLLAVVMFCTQAGQSIAAICLVLVPTESVPKHFAATAIGFMNLSGEFFGGFLAPLLGGALAQRIGLAVPLWMAAGGAAIVVVAALCMRATAPVQPESARELRPGAAPVSAARPGADPAAP